MWTRRCWDDGPLPSLSGWSAGHRVVSYQIHTASSDQCDEILTNCGVFVKCEYQSRPDLRCLFTMINFSTQFPAFTFLCCSIKAAELSSLSVRASRKLKCVQTLSSSPPVSPPCQLSGEDGSYWILISPRPQSSLYAGQRIFSPFCPEMHRNDKCRQCSVQSVSGSDGWVVSVTASAARQRRPGQRRHLQR